MFSCVRDSQLLSAPEPGELHFDIKEMILSMGGYRYIVFLIDAHSRFVFYDFRVKPLQRASAAWQLSMRPSGPQSMTRRGVIAR